MTLNVFVLTLLQWALELSTDSSPRVCLGTMNLHFGVKSEVRFPFAKLRFLSLFSMHGGLLMADHFFSSKDLTIYLLMSKFAVGETVLISRLDLLPITMITFTLPLAGPLKIWPLSPWNTIIFTEIREPISKPEPPKHILGWKQNNHPNNFSMYWSYPHQCFPQFFIEKNNSGTP